VEWAEWEQLLSNKRSLIIEQIINNVQEENNMSYSKCFCNNRGIPQTAKVTNVRRAWRGGSWEIVKHYDYPCCNAPTQTFVEVYGRSITAARLAVLQAM